MVGTQTNTTTTPEGTMGYGMGCWFMVSLAREKQQNVLTKEKAGTRTGTGLHFGSATVAKVLLKKLQQIRKL